MYAHCSGRRTSNMATIVLVEDTGPSRDALVCRLERRGFQVVPAVDGAQAVQLARQLHPDLILMDLGLPVSGWEATRQLKSDLATLHIPIIALGAHADIDDRELAMAAGGGDCDATPVRFDRLLDKIESCLLKGAIAR